MWVLVSPLHNVETKVQRGRMPKREAVAEAGFKPGGSEPEMGGPGEEGVWKQEGRAHGVDAPHHVH